MHAEKELVALLRQGDREALSQLYFSHVKPLSYFILRAAKSPALTEDVIHDTFIKIWEHRDRLDPEQPFKAYLYTIARRTLINLLNRVRREEHILAEIKKDVIMNPLSTDQIILVKETNKLLSDAIVGLPPGCREVFIQCRVNGLSHKQAATVLGISESTVNNQMGRALKKIKKNLCRVIPVPQMPA
ncbi:RNA polymerase sigma-70 factor [Chitinophaga sp. OAE865]|uniref:RNA polymerase sigma factor n=1 Tax=Chitinophaga sp. OAE865 TaxID=2817898 RepID=UPI001AE2B89F